MAIMASDSGGGDYQPVPQGTYDAICYKIVDAGTSMNKFQDEVNKQHSIFIFWELPTCRTEDDRPMSIFHKYRLSLRENAKLRSHFAKLAQQTVYRKRAGRFRYYEDPRCHLQAHGWSDQRRQRKSHRCVLCRRWPQENGNRKRTGDFRP